MAGRSPAAGPPGDARRSGDDDCRLASRTGRRLAGRTGRRRRAHPEPKPRRRRRRPQVTAVLATNSRALWYLTRGFGLVALILLTVTMVLGLTEAVRYARPGWPR